MSQIHKLVNKTCVFQEVACLNQEVQFYDWYEIGRYLRNQKKNLAPSRAEVHRHSICDMAPNKGNLKYFSCYWIENKPPRHLYFS